MTYDFKTLIELLDYFKNEDVCKQFLIEQRWSNGVVCPHCESTKIYNTNRGYKCANKECYKKFSVTSGTIFENTKIALRIWFGAMYLATTHKKGISSLQLATDLGITQKTAWFLLHRIREMVKSKDETLLDGTVEVDETYVGGKNKNRHEDKKIANSQGRSAIDKTPVIGLLERDGKVRTFVVGNTEASTIQPIMRAKVSKNATVVTDAYRSYNGLGKDYNHKVVKGGNEGNGYYLLEGIYHTNTIEGFWSLFKRGIIGIYHYVSPKHLHRYCAEFEHRYNNRKENKMLTFHLAFENFANNRLTYSKLIAN